MRFCTWRRGKTGEVVSREGTAARDRIRTASDHIIAEMRRMVDTRFLINFAKASVDFG